MAGHLATWQNLVQFNNAVATEMYNAVQANFLPYSLWDVTTANAAAVREQVNYKMIVGDADSQFQSNVRFRDHLLGLGIDPQFQVLPGVEHVGGAYVNEGSGLRLPQASTLPRTFTGRVTSIATAMSTWMISTRGEPRLESATLRLRPTATRTA